VREVPRGWYDEQERKQGGRGGGGAAGEDRDWTGASLRPSFGSGSGMGNGKWRSRERGGLHRKNECSRLIHEQSI
jgi:hypothetical protein